MTVERKTAASRVVRIPGTESLDPFGSEFAVRWIESLTETGAFGAGPVLIPSAEMIDEACFLAKKGFAVKVAAGDKDGASRVKQAAKQAGAGLAAVFDLSLLELKPWHVGPVSSIVDRSVLAGLSETDRFAYANRVGRILPSGCHLVGVFRIGALRDSPPHALPMDVFQRIIHRYFASESFQLAQAVSPGRDEAWCGVFKRK